MPNLASLVKNINPPMEISQTQYNALTTSQKNDGTIYFINEGRTIPAIYKSGILYAGGNVLASSVLTQRNTNESILQDDLSDIYNHLGASHNNFFRGKIIAGSDYEI